MVKGVGLEFRSLIKRCVLDANVFLFHFAVDSLESIFQKWLNGQQLYSGCDCQTEIGRVKSSTG